MSFESIEAVIRSGRFIMMSTADGGTIALPLTEAGELVTDGPCVQSNLKTPRATFNAIVRAARLMLRAVGDAAPTEAYEEQEHLRIHSAFILGYLKGKGPDAKTTHVELVEAYDERTHRAIYEPKKPEDIAAAKMLAKLRTP